MEDIFCTWILGRFAPLFLALAALQPQHQVFILHAAYRTLVKKSQMSAVSAQCAASNVYCAVCSVLCSVPNV